MSASQLSALKFSYDQSSDFGKATAKFVHDQLKANLGIDITLQPLDSNTLGSHLGVETFSSPARWAGARTTRTRWTGTTSS